MSPNQITFGIRTKKCVLYALFIFFSVLLSCAMVRRQRNAAHKNALFEIKLPCASEIVFPTSFKRDRVNQVSRPGSVCMRETKQKSQAIKAHKTGL